MFDRDVKPGSNYYYLVGAVNESGITGLRKAPPPVTAEDMARYAVEVTVRPIPPTEGPDLNLRFQMSP